MGNFKKFKDGNAEFKGNILRRLLQLVLVDVVTMCSCFYLREQWIGYTLGFTWVYAGQ